MAITKEAKRVKFGQSLTDFNNQGISACSQLEGIKTNLINMKTTLATDTDFTAEDQAEVQAVIVSLATRIQTILS